MMSDSMSAVSFEDQTHGCNSTLMANLSMQILRLLFS